MSDTPSGWDKYEIHVIQSLKRIEESQAQQAERIDKMETLLSEVRGAWRIAVVVAGFVGALLTKFFSKVVSI